MERTIISHDDETGVARIKFEHNGVIHEADYDLRKVIPGSEGVLKEMGIAFDKSMQDKALEKLTEVIQKQIEDGVIVNPPEPEEPEYLGDPNPPENDTPAEASTEAAPVEPSTGNEAPAPTDQTTPAKAEAVAEAKSESEQK